MIWLGAIAIVVAVGCVLLLVGTIHHHTVAIGRQTAELRMFSDSIVRHSAATEQLLQVVHRWLEAQVDGLLLTARTNEIKLQLIETLKNLRLTVGDRARTH